MARSLTGQAADRHRAATRLPLAEAARAIEGATAAYHEGLRNVPHRDLERVVPSGPSRVIEPRRGWRSLELEELWCYRSVLASFLRRDIKAAHKQTVLGIAWFVLSPLVTVAVYSLVFGRMFGLPSDGHPYPVLVFSGQYLWGAFIAALIATTGSVVHNAYFINKIYFPRLLIPISAGLNTLFNLALAFIALLAVMGAYGYWPSPSVVFAPVIVMLVLATAIGLGMFLAPLEVRYRDVGRLVTFCAQAGFFLTPVLYPISAVSPEYRGLLAFNPVAGYISAFRWSLYGTPLEPWLVASSLLMTVGFVGVGAFYYVRVEGRFADVI